MLEGTQITFSRSAYRDHSSRYWLNGYTAHFKDIAAELHAAGVDIVHNRFLILQVSSRWKRLHLLNNSNHHLIRVKWSRYR